MTIDIAALIAPIEAGALRLEQLDEAHRDGLRAACAADRDIWAIYPTDLSPKGFDAGFAAILANTARFPFALIEAGETIGMSGYLNLAPDRQTLEIGGTYMRPAARGTGLNGRIKRLLIERAFGCGIRRIEFRVDARNTRSLAAAAKIGAVREGLLRAERVTWTGHVRDTVILSLLREEWR